MVNQNMYYNIKCWMKNKALINELKLWLNLQLGSQTRSWTISKDEVAESEVEIMPQKKCRK